VAEFPIDVQQYSLRSFHAGEQRGPPSATRTRFCPLKQHEMSPLFHSDLKVEPEVTYETACSSTFCTLTRCPQYTHALSTGPVTILSSSCSVLLWLNTLPLGSEGCVSPAPQCYSSTMIPNLHPFLQGLKDTLSSPILPSGLVFDFRSRADIREVQLSRSHLFLLPPWSYGPDANPILTNFLSFSNWRRVRTCLHKPFFLLRAFSFSLLLFFSHSLLTGVGAASQKPTNKHGHPVFLLECCSPESPSSTAWLHFQCVTSVRVPFTSHFMSSIFAHLAPTCSF
jgi:hypothetical protein